LTFPGQSNSLPKNGDTPIYIIYFIFISSYGQFEGKNVALPVRQLGAPFAHWRWPFQGRPGQEARDNNQPEGSIAYVKDEVSGKQWVENRITHTRLGRWGWGCLGKKMVLICVDTPRKGGNHMKTLGKIGGKNMAFMGGVSLPD